MRGLPKHFIKLAWSSISGPKKIVVGALLALNVLLFFTVAPRAHSLGGTKVSGNLIYSWWINPVARYIDGNTYFSGITSSGAWRVFKQGTDTEWTELDKDGSGDDHNAPSILTKSGKDTLVFYTRHGTQPYISYRRAPEGTLDFGVRRYIQFPDKVTYTQVMSHGESIVVFTRSGSGLWRYVVSEDYGESWSEPVNFIYSSTGRVYLNFQLSETESGLYHFAVAYNPANTNPHFIAYGTLDLSTGDIANSQETLGNIYSHGGLPITRMQLDNINPLPSSSQKVRLLEVGDKRGRPVIYYAKWGGGTTSRYYQAVQNIDGSWTRSYTGIPTGRTFGGSSASHYVGGIALDRNDNNYVYVSAENNRRWTITRYLINEDMKLSSPEVLAINNVPIVRPLAVRGSNSVLYQVLIEYDSFKTFRSHIYKISS